MVERATIADDLLRGLGEIAAFTGFGEKRAFRLLQNGTLPAFKIGRIWHMRKSTYTDWMNRQEPVMPPAPPEVPAYDQSHSDESNDIAEAESGEGDDVEILTLPPGQYHQRKLHDGRVVLLRRGPVGNRLRARDQQFREIDDRRARRRNLRLPPEGC
jgi:hypothetical protein